MIPDAPSPANPFPPAQIWVAELAALSDSARLVRLHEMVQHVKAHGRCGSLQTANGLPCRRTPKIGYTVCRKHGDRAPQTMAKAERLLAVARIPAIEGLLDELDQYDEETCDTCGYPRHTLKERKYITGIRFRLLDRLGMGPRTTVDLVARRLEDQPLDVTVLTDEEFEELGGLLAQLEQFKRRIRARLAPAGQLTIPSVPAD
jgi:hypothetical protein